jgi:hypothetical protein
LNSKVTPTPSGHHKGLGLFLERLRLFQIGSIYYANINNEAFKTNGNYVTKEAIIAEADANLDQAASALSGISNDAAQT